jgi:hypothetical protein
VNFLDGVFQVPAKHKNRPRRICPQADASKGERKHVRANGPATLPLDRQLAKHAIP